jgi:hypothetical protein
MELAPRHVHTLVALFDLHESHPNEVDFPYKAIAGQSKKTVEQIRRAVSEIKVGKPDIILERHVDGRVQLRLNPDRIVTSRLTARIIIRLAQAATMTHPRIGDFAKDIAKSDFYRRYQGADKVEPEVLITWLFRPETAYAQEAPEAPDRIARLPRMLDEMEYLKEIALPE